MSSSGPDNDPEPLSRRVVEKVADAKGKQPMDVEPLYRRIDPDSLNNLFGNSGPRTARCDGRLSFQLAGCEVVVWADESIDVYTEESTIPPAGTYNGGLAAAADSPD